jgi:hypothetical protein
MKYIILGLMVSMLSLSVFSGRSMRICESPTNTEQECNTALAKTNSYNSCCGSTLNCCLKGPYGWCPNERIGCN